MRSECRHRYHGYHNGCHVHWHYCDGLDERIDHAGQHELQYVDKFYDAELNDAVDHSQHVYFGYYQRDGQSVSNHHARPHNSDARTDNSLDLRSCARTVERS